MLNRSELQVLHSRPVGNQLAQHLHQVLFDFVLKFNSFKPLSWCFKFGTYLFNAGFGLKACLLRPHPLAIKSETIITNKKTVRKHQFQIILIVSFNFSIGWLNKTVYYNMLLMFEFLFVAEFNKQESNKTSERFFIY